VFEAGGEFIRELKVASMAYELPATSAVRRIRYRNIKIANRIQSRVRDLSLSRCCQLKWSVTIGSFKDLHHWLGGSEAVTAVRSQPSETQIETNGLRERLAHPPFRPQTG
jgi:hypothetical protein